MVGGTGNKPADVWPVRLTGFGATYWCRQVDTEFWLQARRYPAGSWLVWRRADGGPRTYAEAKTAAEFATFRADKRKA